MTGLLRYRLEGHGARLELSSQRISQMPATLRLLTCPVARRPVSLSLPLVQSSLPAQNGWPVSAKYSVLNSASLALISPRSVPHAAAAHGTWWQDCYNDEETGRGYPSVRCRPCSGAQPARRITPRPPLRLGPLVFLCPVCASQCQLAKARAFVRWLRLLPEDPVVASRNQ